MYLRKAKNKELSTARTVETELECILRKLSSSVHVKLAVVTEHFVYGQARLELLRLSLRVNFFS